MTRITTCILVRLSSFWIWLASKKARPNLLG